MLKILRKLLETIIEDIDSGNSNMCEEDLLNIVEMLRKYTRKDFPISKYQAYSYLGISRASFDNLVREGKLPSGKKQAGFKELMWTKKDLDEYIKSSKDD